MEMKFNPFPILETNRLLLRQIVTSDADDIFIIRSDATVMRYIPRPIAQTVDDVLPLIAMIEDYLVKGERINWAMELKATGKLIGMIGFVQIKEQHFRAEVGYALSANFHRNGYMLEALKRIIQYGFEEMNLHSIEAIVDADNVASNALLLHAGFVKEAYFREDFYHNTSFRNSIHYGLLRSDSAIDHKRNNEK
jgi:ribosomal-protein-alanine N-acetyltransferase